jgi:hypothetical protein
VQPGQALAAEAVPPLGDGVGVAAQFGGDVVVAGLVGRSAAEDQAGAEGQDLRGRVGAGQALQLDLFEVGQDDAGGFATHGHGPCAEPAGDGVADNLPKPSASATDHLYTKVHVKPVNLRNPVLVS